MTFTGWRVAVRTLGLNVGDKLTFYVKSLTDPTPATISFDGTGWIVVKGLS